jgi:hypothetical protein
MALRQVEILDKHTRLKESMTVGGYSFHVGMARQLEQGYTTASMLQVAGTHREFAALRARKAPHLTTKQLSIALKDYARSADLYSNSGATNSAHLSMAALSYRHAARIAKRMSDFGTEMKQLELAYLSYERILNSTTSSKSDMQNQIIKMNLEQMLRVAHDLRKDEITISQIKRKLETFTE